MSVSEQEWQKEQARVDRVIQVIDRQMAVLSEQVGEVKADIVHLRKHFWDDLSLPTEQSGGF
jgi:DNA helicase-2/ATP-dependent DNA helicase PcrA